MNPPNHSSLINYFSECYQRDSREQSFWNIYDKKYEYLKVLDSNIVINMQNNFLPEGYGDYAETVTKVVETYKREKSFLYSSFFYVGRATSESAFSGRLKQLCAPLVYFDAKIAMGPTHATLNIDYYNYTINRNLLNLITPDHVNLDKIDTSFFSDVKHPDFTKRLISYLKIIEADADCELLQNKSTFYDSRSLKKEVRRSNEEKGKFNPVIIPAGALLVAPKSINTRGIIDELETLSTQQELSSPLNKILGLESESNYKVVKPEFGALPGLLNSSQKEALKNASQDELSIIMGPPGTGKSYSIASIALDRFLSGESVLIVSATENAIDALHNILTTAFNISLDSIIRTGRTDHFRSLKSYLSVLLELAPGSLMKPTKDFHPTSFLPKLTKLIDDLIDQENIFSKRCKLAVRDGLFFHDYMTAGYWGRWWRAPLKALLNRRINSSLTLFEELTQVRKILVEREKLATDYISLCQRWNISKVLSSARKELSDFSRALRARTSGKQQNIFAELDYASLLAAFPIWLAPLNGLHKSLPLKKDLFDVVIFDEATQCNLSMCLPALQRAKRAVVVGDTKQLRHFSFLSNDIQHKLASKYKLKEIDIELDYRNNSMIDYANHSVSDQSSITMLNEHFRSHPRIISYSNKRYYRDNLRIMTERPAAAYDNPFEIIECDGIRKRGINKIEAEKLLERVENIIALQQQLPAEDRLSIGILSFFSDQAKHLEKEILNRFSLETLKIFKLKAGTPYSFQGQERDVMFISCAIDKDSSRSAYIYLNRADVFNVAITRARHKQILFVSAPLDAIPSNSYLYDYLKEIADNAGVSDKEENRRDKLSLEVSNFLIAEGYNTHIHYPIAGVIMDIVITFRDITIAVDLIGFPGETLNAIELEHYHIFERAGLKIFPISFMGWMHRKDEVLGNLKKLIHTEEDAPEPLVNTSNDTEHGIAKYLPENHVAFYKNLNTRLIQLEDDKALDQLIRFKEKYILLMETIGSKLEAGELTYRRYKQTIDQILLSSFDNLENIVFARQSLQSLSLYSYSDGSEDLNDEDGSSFKKQNESLIQAQQQRLTDILKLNEEAMSLLDEAIVKFSNLNTGGNQAEFNMQDMIEDLRGKVGSIEKYSVDSL